MKCSNYGCHNYDEHAAEPCQECVKREQQATVWIRELLRDEEKEQNAKRYERKNKKQRRDE